MSHYKNAAGSIEWFNHVFHSVRLNGFMKIALLIVGTLNKFNTLFPSVLYAAKLKHKLLQWKPCLFIEDHHVDRFHSALEENMYCLKLSDNYLNLRKFRPFDFYKTSIQSLNDQQINDEF